MFCVFRNTSSPRVCFDFIFISFFFSFGCFQFFLMRKCGICVKLTMQWALVFFQYLIEMTLIEIIQLLITLHKLRMDLSYSFLSFGLGLTQKVSIYILQHKQISKEKEQRDSSRKVLVMARTQNTYFHRSSFFISTSFRAFLDQKSKRKSISVFRIFSLVKLIFTCAFELFFYHSVSIFSK